MSKIENVTIQVSKPQMETIVDMVGNYGMVSGFADDAPMFADEAEKEYVMTQLLRAFLSMNEGSR